jgi:hypothetical protein
MKIVNSDNIVLINTDNVGYEQMFLFFSCFKIYLFYNIQNYSQIAGLNNNNDIR